MPFQHLAVGLLGGIEIAVTQCDVTDDTLSPGVLRCDGGGL